MQKPPTITSLPEPEYPEVLRQAYCLCTQSDNSYHDPHAYSIRQWYQAAQFAVCDDTIRYRAYARSLAWSISVCEQSGAHGGSHTGEIRVSVCRPKSSLSYLGLGIASRIWPMSCITQADASSAHTGHAAAVI